MKTPSIPSYLSGSMDLSLATASASTKREVTLTVLPLLTEHDMQNRKKLNCLPLGLDGFVLGQGLGLDEERGHAQGVSSLYREHNHFLAKFGSNQVGFNLRTGPYSIFFSILHQLFQNKKFFSQFDLPPSNTNKN